MEEIPLNPPWPHCRLLRGPLTPERYKRKFYTCVLHDGHKLPELWFNDERAIVSARARAVFEANDDFEHEYIETVIQNEQRQRINEQPYYLMNVRRFVQVEELGGRIENQSEMFRPNYYEKRCLPTVQRNGELKARLAELPLWLWRSLNNTAVVYLNETMLQALRGAGIAGVDPYSSYDGEAGEAVARFE